MDKYLKRKQADETDENASESECDNNCQTSAADIQDSKKVRRYEDEYVKYGFIESSTNSGRPQCLICHKILLNEALKPAKLKRTLETNHPELACKPKSRKCLTILKRS